MKKRFSLKHYIKSINPFVKQFVLGGLIGFFVLHPLTMVIYWFEFNSMIAMDTGLVEFILRRIVKSFSFTMVPMTIIFILLGGILGMVFGYFYKALARKDRLIRYLTEITGNDLESILAKGEGETIEFKSSIRWNSRLEKVDKALEMVAIKTIAGFMNNQYGTLLVGVNDSGEVVGLLPDYLTFKRSNRDGFEQYLMTLISLKMGADLCPFIHVLFHQYKGMDVCRIIAESAPHPVYVRDGASESFYLRTGNITRELTVHEAIEHVAQHWPNG